MYFFRSSFVSPAGRVAQSMHVGSNNSLAPATPNHRDPSPTKSNKETPGMGNFICIQMYNI